MLRIKLTKEQSRRRAHVREVARRRAVQKRRLERERIKAEKSAL